MNHATTLNSPQARRRPSWIDRLVAAADRARRIPRAQALLPGFSATAMPLSFQGNEVFDGAGTIVARFNTTMFRTADGRVHIGMHFSRVVASAFRDPAARLALLEGARQQIRSPWRRKSMELAQVTLDGSCLLALTASDVSAKGVWS